jgi:AcrR family transcriptional regulator
VKPLARQKAERRERILEAARAVIGERGYDALTMRDLARTSRVTVPTIYNLVGGKEDVLFAAVEEQTARFVAGIRAAGAKGPGSGVLAVVDACARELLRLPGYYRSLLQLFFTSASASPARDAVSLALYEQLAAGVAELRESGELAAWVDERALCERLLSHLIFTSMQWASGALGRETLRAVALYDACLVLMGVTEGATRDALQRRAVRLQARARAGQPTPAGTLRASLGAGA